MSENEKNIDKNINMLEEVDYETIEDEDDDENSNNLSEKKIINLASDQESFDDTEIYNKEIKNNWLDFEFKEKEIYPISTLMEYNGYNNLEEFLNNCPIFNIEQPIITKTIEPLDTKKSTNFSNNRLQKVTQNMINRLSKFGMLEEEDKIIKKNKNNNDRYYEKDDSFIDDDDEHQNTKMEIKECKYEEFGCFIGDLTAFKKSTAYKTRKVTQQPKKKKK